MYEAGREGKPSRPAVFLPVAALCKIYTARVDFFNGAVYNGAMKKFKYSFPRLTLILIIAGLAVCLAGFIVNLYVCITQGISYAVNPALPIVLYILMFFITIVAGGLLVSVLCSSYYSVNKKTLRTAFGFIRSSYDVKQIDIVVLDRETNKLMVYFKDESYIIIVIKPSQYTDFVQAILDVNPSIEYAIQSVENTPDDKNDKKKK